MSDTKPIVIKYIDLCCGIGGFRIGINNYEKKNKKYKFKCVFSADIKDDAIKCYNINFSENMTRTDIYDIKKLPRFDLLCAGFPCQPFSSAGTKRGFNDSRGGLIFKILKICKKCKPKYIILENVSNLITLKKGYYIKKIEDMFTKLKYNVAYKKLNSCNFGVPQSRERVYIICSLQNKLSFDQIKFQPQTTLLNVIDDNSKYTDIDLSFAKRILDLHKKHKLYGYRLQDKRGGKNNIHSWDINYHGKINKQQKILMGKIMLERRKKHWAEKKNITWMDGMPLTYTEIQTFHTDENLKKNLNDLVQKGYLRIEKCKDLINGRRIYKEDSELGYNICKGKLSFPISKILDPNGLAPTLTATDSVKLVFIIDNKYIRKINDTEIKKICGFPSSFIIPNDVNKYDLFGNMVTPPVITALLDIIL